MKRTHRSVSLLVAGLLPACVATNVVVVDQRTALERQAAGDYPELENEVEQAGLAPSPEPLSREALVEGRAREGRGALGELAELVVDGESDVDTIDRLLLPEMCGRGTASPARAELPQLKPARVEAARSPREPRSVDGRHRQ
jgi:hypothetical protein